MRPLSWRALESLALFVAAMILWGQLRRSFRDQGKTQVADSTAVSHVHTADTVFVHDTIVRSRAINAFRANIQPIILGDPTPREAKIITLADTVLRADSSALADCSRQVAARDTLIRRLQTPKPQPWVTPFGEMFYAPKTKQIDVKAGLTTRPMLGGLRVEIAGETSPWFNGVLVGFRKDF